jgi:NADH dehydrogenase
MTLKRVVIVGGGFGGINCAKALAGRSDVSVCLIDRRNYHLFQPLLYQVAMAGLSEADIASPIRSLFSSYENVRVVQAEVTGVDVNARQVKTAVGSFEYDYVVLASGAQHAYFGNEQWEDHAPGLKNLEQATEIRRRVLTAFERAECEPDPSRRRALLTFAVIGGGPTGVELAGAIGEMTRFTLARDFRNIDPKLTRIVLIEAGPRILPSFDPELASRAARELEQLGVQVWVNSRVTDVTANGVRVGEEHLACNTVIWGAGVQASPLGKSLPAQSDAQGRVMVGEDLTLADQKNVFVIGDQAHFRPADAQRALPGVASVAIQQGRHVARLILADLHGQPRAPFRFHDKGQMATIGRRRAVLQRGRFRSAGTFAWGMWLLVHIYFLSGFRNRVFVLLHWCWSYLTFSRGSRLIVEKHWHSYAAAPEASVGATLTRSAAPAGIPAPAASMPVPAPALLAPISLPPGARLELLAVPESAPPEGWEEPTRWLSEEPPSAPNPALQPKRAAQLEAALSGTDLRRSA